jgi:D-glycero-alpha-D-manno-heptose-7-phosphate kinase
LPRHVIVRTPLRVSFVGGGSDIPPGPGAVVSCTIDKHVYVVAKWRSDDMTYLSWREKEVVRDPGELRHELVREALREVGIKGGIELLTYADVPGVGSGLGSSSATLVAVLQALFALKGYHPSEIDPEWLASIATRIALVRLGRSQGLQDEYSCAVGGLNRIDFESLADQWTHVRVRRLEEVSPCGWRQLNDSFLLFRPMDPERGRRAEDLLAENLIDDEYRAGCIRLCEEFERYLARGWWEGLAGAVSRHHILKALAFPGYWPPESSESMRGVDLPMKLCGAGGTGHLLVGCQRSEREGVVAEVSGKWGPVLPFSFVRYGTQVIYSE